VGSDELDGGRGNDVLIGDNGKVGLTHGKLARVATIPDFEGAADTIIGGEGTDIMFGGTGYDTIYGSNREDSIVAFDGRAILDTDQGSNKIKSLSNDRLFIFRKSGINRYQG